MVEKIARAIALAPELWHRRNKGREDGREHEVCYLDGDVISDETLHVVAAFAHPQEAEAFKVRRQREMQALAAMEALLEPSEEMIRAGYETPIIDAGPVSGFGPDGATATVWQAMLRKAMER